MLLICVCLLSAMLFAVGNSVQHVGANNLGGVNLPPLQLVIRLARSRVWLAGSIVTISAFATHLWALSIGAVGLVQPLLLMGVVFAIAIRPLFDRHLPHPGDLVGGLVAVGGLTLYIRAGDIESQPHVAAPSNAAVVTAIAVGLATLLLLAARRIMISRSLVFGLCAGILMGTGAGLFNDIFSAPSLIDELTNWKLPVAICLEIVGTFLNQRAYHSGPIATSMPALNIASVLMGGLYGALVFGEMPAHDVVPVVLQVAGVALAAGGLVSLAMSEDRDEALAAAAAAEDDDDLVEEPV